MALMQITDEISNSMDMNKITIGVFLDLAKAFDTVDHGILLAKLNHYGIRGVPLKWFQSYLANRQQYVVMDGVSSSRSEIQCGVPQGSILGPLLFLIYINDLCSVSTLLKGVMFADDTNFFLTGDDSGLMEVQLNRELNLISSWLRSNLLTLNLEKTVYVMFTRRKIRPINISLYGTLINQVMDIKFLGIIIAHSLKWNLHISAVCSKMAKNIGILSKVRYFLPLDLRRQLYQTLVEPYMSYCCMIWAADRKTTCLNKVHKMQKRYCRLITFSHFQAHSNPLFKDLKLLTIYGMYKYQVSIYMYKHLHNMLPVSSFLFHANQEIHSHQTRQSFKLHNEYCRTALCKSTLRHQGPRLWNSLPPEFNDLHYNQFKNKLKAYIIDDSGIS